MIEKIVFMHIIGKTLEEIHKFILITNKFVWIGNLKKLSQNIRMVVKMDSNVNFHMAGKRENVILLLLMSIYKNKYKETKNKAVILI